MFLGNFKNVAIIVSDSVFNVPIPSSISYMWNFGSLLSVCLVVQILSGFFISIHYESSITLAFDSVVSLCNNVNFGWIIRAVHSNIASEFFICLYLHIVHFLLSLKNMQSSKNQYCEELVWTNWWRN